MKIQSPLDLEYDKYIEEQKSLYYTPPENITNVLTKEQFRNIFHLPKWKLGDTLQEDEYVLKISGRKGFLAKLKKDGSLLKTFNDWGKTYSSNNVNLCVYIFKETFRKGWKIESHRAGESQDWIELTTPEGFSIEIYMKNFFDTVLLNDTIIKGTLQQEYKWSKKTLILNENTTY